MYPEKLYFPPFPLIQCWGLMRSGVWVVLSSLSNTAMGNGGGGGGLAGVWSNFLGLSGNFGADCLKNLKD